MNPMLCACDLLSLKSRATETLTLAFPNLAFRLVFAAWSTEQATTSCSPQDRVIPAPFNNLKAIDWDFIAAHILDHMQQLFPGSASSPAFNQALAPLAVAATHLHDNSPPRRDIALEVAQFVHIHFIPCEENAEEIWDGWGAGIPRLDMFRAFSDDIMKLIEEEIKL